MVNGRSTSTAKRAKWSGLRHINFGIRGQSDAEARCLEGTHTMDVY